MTADAPVRHRTSSTDPVPIAPSQVAAELGVTPATVRRWIDAGRLPALRTPGGQYRIRRADLEAVMVLTSDEQRRAS